jgi:hypothetical protein
MGIKTFAAKLLARREYRRTLKWSRQPGEAQKRVFQELLRCGRETIFGEDHDFSYITTYRDFRENVPIRDYEALRPYIYRIFEGGENVLWSGKPLYFAKTSGTTSGIKYIPISKDSMPYHITAARNALLAHIYETGNTGFLNGKMIFLSGSPKLDEKSGILTGRLSGIVNHHVPSYLRGNQLPSYKTNCIEDWEQKLDKIVEETIDENMALISGIPPWVQMYFDRLEQQSGKKIGKLFPKFSVLVHGGVNFEPYKSKLFESIGRRIHTIETFPASEGFMAYQDSQKEEGLLLLLNSGIFYEFIPANEVFNEHPTRLTIGQVETGVNYAIILNTNAGLWGYNIGDTVRFVSTNPYRIVVTGRIKHFISAFGEHVIGEEVDQAMSETAKRYGAKVLEFTVAPQVNPPEGGAPYHEWFVEFETVPENLDAFALALDDCLQKKNIYYRDLIAGHILQPLKIRPMQKDAFIQYMRSVGRLGGQNKLPRLSNDRVLVDNLSSYIMPALAGVH